MAGKRDSSGKLLDRSLGLLKGLSDHLQREAARALRKSGLRVHLASLRRRRAESLRLLGEAAQRSLVAQELNAETLLPLSGRITELEEKIALAEREIAELIAAAPAGREASGDKPPREFRRLELVSAQSVLDRSPLITDCRSTRWRTSSEPRMKRCGRLRRRSRETAVRRHPPRGESASRALVYNTRVGL
jgi:hypothetical protein